MSTFERRHEPVRSVDIELIDLVAPAIEATEATDEVGSVCQDEANAATQPAPLVALLDETR